MKVSISSDERYPEWIVEPTDSDWGYEMPAKLYKEYQETLKAFNKTQDKIKRFLDKQPRINTKPTHICHSCA